MISVDILKGYPLESWKNFPQNAEKISLEILGEFPLEIQEGFPSLAEFPRNTWRNFLEIFGGIP